MNALIKIATITNLVAEIGDCDEVQFSLDGFIKVLTELKTALAEPPKKVVMKYQLDADGNRIGKGVPVPNTFEPHPSFVKRSSLDLKDGVWTLEEEVRENKLTPPETEEEEDEEDDDSVVSCKCNDRMDIRGRCDPIRSAKQFSKCPVRVDTTYFHINNDFEKYQDIQSACSRREKYEKYFAIARAEPYCLKDAPYSNGDSLLDEMLTELIEQDERQEEENCCVICDNFVSLAEEEDEAKWSNSQDRWCCAECIDTHYCDNCEDIADDFGEVEEYEGKMLCVECIDTEKDDTINNLKDEILGFVNDKIENEDKETQIKILRKILDNIGDIVM